MSGMSNQARIQRDASRYGATVDWCENRGDVMVDTPSGFVWAESGCHCIVEQFMNVSGDRWTTDAANMVIERMACGLAKCDEADCDVCQE